MVVPIGVLGNGRLGCDPLVALCEGAISLRASQPFPFRPEPLCALASPSRPLRLKAFSSHSSTPSLIRAKSEAVPVPDNTLPHKHPPALPSTPPLSAPPPDSSA